MVTTVILGMLCVYLLCFSVMFLLISTRLIARSAKPLDNLLLGLAYILQLFGGPPDEGLVSVINHTLTLSAPVVYVLGAMRFSSGRRPCCARCSP